MNSGKGELVPLSEKRAKTMKDVFEKADELSKLGIFQVGETLEIRGSKFQVHKISRKELRLRILPD